MEKINLNELVQAVGGTLLQPADGTAGPAPETGIEAVVIDSRRITPGCVFFAIPGERFDGHAYVDSALEKGAAGCVVSRAPEKMLPGRFYVLVADTRRAIGDLAHYYRSRFDVKVVGITGSVGKTTCRGMVTSVLSKHFRVHATEGNFNNDLGLPLTIFGLSAQDEVLVLEMGMNHPGEIRRLSQIAVPDLAVITNVGTAHIGILGSRENIFLAKKEIFEGMPAGACAVLCGDDDFLPRISRMPELTEKYRILYAGKSGFCGCRIEDVHMEASIPEGDASRVDFSTVCRLLLPEGAQDGGSGTGRALNVRIPAAGLHLAYPAAIAAAVGSLLGMTDEEIREGIQDFRSQRMPCEKIGEIILFDDTYNASPESMRSSLQVLSALPVEKKAAVLGDMLEQGEFAGALHREVGLEAAKAGIDTLIAIGPLSAEMAKAAEEAGLADVRSYPDRESAAAAVEEITKPGTAILFKASHGMALDQLAQVSRAHARTFVEGA